MFNHMMFNHLYNTEDTLLRIPLKIPDQDYGIFNALRLEKLNEVKLTTIIAGGTPLQWFTGNTVSDGDIDLWFSTEKDYIDFYEYLVKRLKAKTKYESQHAVTFKVDSGPEIIPVTWKKDLNLEKTVVSNRSYCVQLIKNVFGNNVTGLMRTFDFSVSSIFTDGYSIYMSRQTHDDIQNKVLRITGKLSNNIVRRVLKYMVYGYNITDEDMERVIKYYNNNQPDVNLAMALGEYDF